jgi:hypothetical protein
VLLYDAEMVAEVDTSTTEVLTVKVALVLPAGTVTLDGTLAAPLLLESITCARTSNPITRFSGVS